MPQRFPLLSAAECSVRNQLGPTVNATVPGIRRNSQTTCRLVPAWTQTLLCALAFAAIPPPCFAGVFELTVTDKNDRPIACRVHLRDSAGKPVRPASLPFFHDHFTCPGTVRLELAAGRYTYAVEKGPEFRRLNGAVDLANQPMVLRLVIERFADLARDRWHSGDLHVHRPIDDLPLLLDAEDLAVAPVITWWNRQNQWRQRPLPNEPLVRLAGPRFYHLLAGEDERQGGALLYFNLRRPLDIATPDREYPSPVEYLNQARRDPAAWVDVEKPFWWDVPVWLATGKVDSIGLANNHMCRSQMYESEAWGKPRDAARLPPPRGTGFWSQEIYYHVLECGLRVPPSAGSASGVLPNPIGYNRVYVHVDGPLTYDKWWTSLRAGRSFVTNGPLLLVRANGALPGHVFRAAPGQQLDIALTATIAAQDPISTIEVVRDGRVTRAVPFAEWQKTGSLGTLHFSDSGWFLVRAIADLTHTFRFASTAPFYVEVGARRRVRRASAQFFLDWVEERARQIQIADPTRRTAVLQHHNHARAFWSNLVEIGE